MAKKDFSGKSKKKDTYDKDWVFSSDQGAWVTKRQNKQYTQGQKEAHDYNKGIRAAGNPTTPPPPPAAIAPPTTAPILMPSPRIDPVPLPPGLGKDPMQEPAPDTQIPSWWINQAIQNPTDPNSQFANVANALLPTLAPEDQRTLATYLSTNFKDVYGGYANTNFGTAPTEITDAVRKQYLSPQRAQTALTLLDKMKTASGSQDMGAGYGFLQNAVKLITQFVNPQGVMGRENYGQFTNAVSSLVGQGNSDKDMSAYANLAQLFNMPKFTAGPIIGNTPNNRLFG